MMGGFVHDIPTLYGRCTRRIVSYCATQPLYLQTNSGVFRPPGILYISSAIRTLWGWLNIGQLRVTFGDVASSPNIQAIDVIGVLMCSVDV